ncbi:MAG: hypothetical protein U0270_05340 [Labilithrix sp.]
MVMALGLCALSCSKRGNQHLYIASDDAEELNVTINGERREQTMSRGFQAYPEAKLTKGAEVIIEKNGQVVDRATLPPVEEGMSALFLVGGAPGLQLVDYKKLGTVTDSKGHGGGSNPYAPGIGGVSRSAIDVVEVDRTTKTLAFDRRAVVSGPDDKLPAGGNVNQLTLEKFPVYRLERVPAGADVFDTIRPKLDSELGTKVKR